MNSWFPWWVNKDDNEEDGKKSVFMRQDKVIMDGEIRECAKGATTLFWISIFLFARGEIFEVSGV